MIVPQPKRVGTADATTRQRPNDLSGDRNLVSVRIARKDGNQMSVQDVVNQRIKSERGDGLFGISGYYVPEPQTSHTKPWVQW